MDIINILKNNKKSITNERVEIFEYIKNKHIFSSNDLINHFSSLWRASVFRIIKLFLELWIVRNISLWDKNDLYELNDLLNHHEHMKCEKCWIIINFNSEEICKNIEIKANNLWFKIKNHSINIVWICSKCL